MRRAARSFGSRGLGGTLTHGPAGNATADAAGGVVVE
jgi:hypothetical protein